MKLFLPIQKFINIGLPSKIEYNNNAIKSA